MNYYTFRTSPHMGCFSGGTGARATSIERALHRLTTARIPLPDGTVVLVQHLIPGSDDKSEAKRIGVMHDGDFLPDAHAREQCPVCSTSLAEHDALALQGCAAVRS